MGAMSSVFIRGGGSNHASILNYRYVLDEVGKRGRWVPHMILRAAGWPTYVVSEIRGLDKPKRAGEISTRETSHGIEYTYTYVGTSIITGDVPDKKYLSYDIILIPVQEVKSVIGGGWDEFNIEYAADNIDDSDL